MHSEFLSAAQKLIQDDTYSCSDWGENGDRTLTLLSDVALLEHGLYEHDIAKRRSLQDDSLALNTDDISMYYPLPAIISTCVCNRVLQEKVEGTRRWDIPVVSRCSRALEYWSSLMQYIHSCSL